MPFPVAAQRVALRANAARGVISHGERQNERWVTPLCAAGSGAIMASIAASGATATAPATHCGDFVRSIAEIYRDETSDLIAGCSATTALFGEVETPVCRCLSQLICHLGEAGHGAFLVAFGARSAHPHGADRLVANLDRHSAA